MCADCRRLSISHVTRRGSCVIPVLEPAATIAGSGLGGGFAGPIFAIVRLPIEVIYINSQFLHQFQLAGNAGARPIPCRRNLPRRLTTRPSPIRRPGQACVPRNSGLRLDRPACRLAFLAPSPVNVTLIHKRDSEFAATLLRMRTVSDHHPVALARTSPRPAPDLIRRSSAARFSSVAADGRNSGSPPRQQNQWWRPAVQGDNRFRPQPRSNGADSSAFTNGSLFLHHHR